MLVKHFDAKTVFLNGELKETIYMKQPQGYEVTRKGQVMVCKLKKGLYGLKQAANIWNKKLDSILKSKNFMQGSADPCLYIKRDGENVIYVNIHVDDFLIASKELSAIDSTAAFLQENLKLIDLGFLQNYLGVEVKKNEDGFYCIKQTKYIEEILERFGLQDAKISHIPVDIGYVKATEAQPLMGNQELYQQLIGALLYLAVNTRPDISASVTILSQSNKQPTSVDWTEAKRISRYLKGTKDYELVLGGNGKEELIGYADADWAANRSNRKSNSGYLFQFMNATISWACRKQTCVSLSSTEAEYVSTAETCLEG